MVKNPHSTYGPEKAIPKYPLIYGVTSPAEPKEPLAIYFPKHPASEGFEARGPKTPAHHGSETPEQLKAPRANGTLISGPKHPIYHGAVLLAASSKEESLKQGVEAPVER